MNRQILLRRIAPIGAALALGGGAGAAIYAATTGPDGGGGTVVASVPAQSAAQTVATTTSTLTQLYKDASPGVVDITVNQSDSSGANPGGGQSQAEGSGFVVDTKGDIVTNAHVVDGATSIKVRFQTGKTAKATLVGADDSTDVAVIKVDVDSSQLHPLSFGTSSSVQVGQSVAAIGSPFGLPESMTSGIVSALNRTITAGGDQNQQQYGNATSGTTTYKNMIQTDAALNEGNSGGPLVNAAGQVIGINSVIETSGQSSSGNIGLGFAIPIDTARQVANQLMKGH